MGQLPPPAPGEAEEAAAAAAAAVEAAEAAEAAAKAAAIQLDELEAKRVAKEFEEEEERQRRQEAQDAKLARKLQRNYAAGDAPGALQEAAASAEDDEAAPEAAADDNEACPTPRDDDVIMVDDSPPPATSSVGAVRGAGSSSGDAAGGAGKEESGARAEQKGKHAEDTSDSDDGEHNARSTLPGTGEGGGSSAEGRSAASHEPAGRTAPSAHALSSGNGNAGKRRPGWRKSPAWEPPLNDRQTRRQAKGDRFTCCQLAMMESPEEFNQSVPTHFVRPKEQAASFAEARDKDHTPGGRLANLLRKTLLECLEKADPQDKVIEWRERSKNSGFTSDNNYTGPDEDKQIYTCIGENSRCTVCEQAGQVAGLLRETEAEDYKGYVIIYLLNQQVKEKVELDFYQYIYTCGYTGNHSSVANTLPGGLQEKFMSDRGKFFQIFWNPGLETCSGTHWDQNDSILYMIQGTKTVEMAQKDASHDKPTLQKWGEGDCKFFSRFAPSEAGKGLHDTITLRAGEALFLPTGVWHRVTSEPDSLAFSMGVTAQDISVDNLRKRENVEEALAAARVAKQAEKAKNQCP
eukprot:Tamp_04865.p1 GENE.Tamp_04865~~Tamp_04865.p1  ORF type:complete len:576 (+),score=136.56 Tamp_04865:749-2476(+)